MSDKEDRTVKRSRLRVRHLLPLALLALVPILLAPAGSAKPTPPVINFGICVQNATTLAPSCSGADTNSNFDPATGTPGAPVQVTITNAGSSTASIGTATIDLPSGLRVDSSVVTPQPSKYVTANATGSAIQVSGTQIQPGKSLLITFAIDTGCDGSNLAWSATAVPFSGSGSFSSQSALSVGENSDLNGVGCHLRFVTQPADTQVGATITDKGASTGGAIKVELDQGASSSAAMTTCPFGAGNCKIKVNDDPTNVGLFTAESNAVDSSTFIASFSDLKISNVPAVDTPATFTLTATGDLGLTQGSVPSNSFLITLYAQDCSGNGCSFSKKQLPGNDTTSFASLIGGTTFDFMTLSPYSLDENNLPAGCQNRPDLGITGFAETDGRHADGTMTITFYANMDNIKAKYGANVGQQFIAMCVGAKPVVNNVAQDCWTQEATGVGGSTNGWLGDSLTNQMFDGGTAKAVCASDGFYWGIISSYQDKLPADNPIVTSWSGQNIGGKNYRAFVMNVPAGWDYRNGP